MYTLSITHVFFNVADLFRCKHLPKLWSELVKEDLESQKHYLREIFKFHNGKRLWIYFYVC